VGWTFVWMMLILKIPVIAAIWLVWWAMKAEPEPVEDDGDGGTKVRPSPHPPTHPRRPGRGPHGDPAPLPSPARVRTKVRSREHQTR
jgi:hypothetical protein